MDSMLAALTLHLAKQLDHLGHMTFYRMLVSCHGLISYQHVADILHACVSVCVIEGGLFCSPTLGTWLSGASGT